MVRFIGFVIVAWMFVSCATELPSPPTKTKDYRQMGREAAQRDAEYMAEYDAFLQGEVKAGRLQPAVADQMYRQEWRAIKGTNKDLDCTSMNMGPMTHTTCR